MKFVRTNIGYSLNNFGWKCGVLGQFGRAFFGILVENQLPRIFEILKYYGTSWKNNILESPSTHRLPPLNPTTLMGKSDAEIAAKRTSLGSRTAVILNLNK